MKGTAKMDNRKIIGLLAIVVAAVLVGKSLLDASGAAPITMQPGATPVVGAACADGEKGSYGCSGTILQWSECYSEKFEPKTFDCQQLSFGDYSGNCDAEKNSCGYDYIPQSTPAPTPVVVTDQQFYEAEEACGDGYCSVSEGCGTCQADCGCTPGEYCDAASDVCVPQDACGDGICSQDENLARTCCSDCGCGASEFCQNTEQACYPASGLSNDAAVTAVRANYPESTWSIREVADVRFNGESAKAVVVEDKFTGEIDSVILDAKGNTIETLILGAPN
ncbi:hypothetical protein AUJ14_03380 [Candidatus Micrarchaeota archaeon CG1_02_55_22]|nr:MAG: hypothetical protein AUJ14_03380 [Candidatus Micrarchaeota archaeon CG1_02_55_22]